MRCTMRENFRDSTRHGAALLLPDHLAGPLGLFGCNISHKQKLSAPEPAFWNGFLKPGNLQRDACDSTPGFYHASSWTRVECESAGLPASTTFQQRVIHLEYEQCHHGEYWTPKQGLYSMS